MSAVDIACLLTWPVAVVVLCRTYLGYYIKRERSDDE